MERRRLCGGSVLGLAALAFAGWACSPARGGEEKKGEPAKPGITLTLVPTDDVKPGPDSWGIIAGKASGVNFAEHKVVLFSYGDIWYVQPMIDNPYTDIDKEGNWKNDTHGGYEYAALLVKASYKPPATTRVLPGVGDEILAIARAKPKPKEEKK